MNFKVSAVVGALVLLNATQAWSLTLNEAVRIAVEANPEIGQAVANREAIEFELRQGRGRYLPRIDLEARAGGEIRDNRTTHSNGDQKHLFFRKEGSIVLRQMLFDGFETSSEVERQASRVDAASIRVFERSEFIALAVVREYLDILRLRRILAISRRNVGYHRSLLSRIGRGTSGGSISVADRQQAQERLFAANARVTETNEEFKAATARFIRLVGRPVGKAYVPKSISRMMPRSLNSAIGVARKNHPSLRVAKADLDASLALIRKAESRYYPKLHLEGRAKVGHNLSGIRGHDNDFQGNVVMSWNLYNGGIDRANRQEQIRRADEQRLKLHQVSREVEEAVRLSWDRRNAQSRRLRQVRSQAGSIRRLTGSYNEQFKIGQRSLLDLLDTQNTLFSAEITISTAATAVKFAEYRLLAATGNLLKVMRVKPNSASKAYARKQANVPKTPPAETMKRYSPNRTGELGPLY